MNRFHPLAFAAALLVAGAASAQQPPPPSDAQPAPQAQGTPMPPPAPQAQAGRMPPPQAQGPSAQVPPPQVQAQAAPVPPSQAQAQPAPMAPPARPPRRMARADAQPVGSAQVQRLLVNPGGDVDGLLLSDGRQVAFPPQRPAGIGIAAGDRIEISGWQVPGSNLVMAAGITGRAGRPVLADGPPPAPSDPAAAPALTAIATSGRVARVLTTDRGDANGVLLDNGVIVRFPPHAAAGMADRLQTGRPFAAQGWGSRTPLGTAIEANAVGADPQSLADVQPGPGPRGPRGPRGPLGAQPDRTALPPPPQAAS